MIDRLDVETNEMNYSGEVVNVFSIVIEGNTYYSVEGSDVIEITDVIEDDVENFDDIVSFDTIVLDDVEMTDEILFNEAMIHAIAETFDESDYDLEQIKGDIETDNFDIECIEEYRKTNIIAMSIVNGQHKQAQEQRIKYEKTT